MGMTITRDPHILELKLVRHADGLDLDLHPLQGLWTEEQYFALTNHTNYLIEYSDGELEVLAAPTSRHQVILLLLYDLFRAVLHPRGKVLVAPLRLQVGSRKYREPDILMLLDATDPRYQDALWLGADLVIEIVSPDRPERDTEEKPRDYAAAGISEYWIVNPLSDRISVLALEGNTCNTTGVFGRGDLARSMLLEGFTVPIDAVFDAT